MPPGRAGSPLNHGHPLAGARETTTSGTRLGRHRTPGPTLGSGGPEDAVERRGHDRTAAAIAPSWAGKPGRRSTVRCLPVPGTDRRGSAGGWGPMAARRGGGLGRSWRHFRRRSVATQVLSVVVGLAVVAGVVAVVVVGSLPRSRAGRARGRARARARTGTSGVPVDQASTSSRGVSACRRSTSSSPSPT